MADNEKNIPEATPPVEAPVPVKRFCTWATSFLKELRSRLSSWYILISPIYDFTFRV